MVECDRHSFWGACCIYVAGCKQSAIRPVILRVILGWKLHICYQLLQMCCNYDLPLSHMTVKKKDQEEGEML